ncbi:MAG: acyloxyacyl hydrolase [Bacteroidales bacterium]|nr:acyloxyacyl hydrolase [Bacteroidales bacterium]
MRRTFYIIILLSATISSIAQQASETKDSSLYSQQSNSFYANQNITPEHKDSKITPNFSLDYLHGNVLKAKELENKNGSNYFQFNATINTATLYDSYLHYWYKKPQIGFSGLIGLLGQKEILGNVYALYPTWNYSLFNNKSIGLNIKLGSGFAWFSTPYNKYDNPQNTLIGSHITNVTELGLGLWFQFLPQWKIETGTSFIHFSNGHTHIPNIGLNDFTAKIGVIYSPGSLQGIALKEKELPKTDTTWKKSISVSLGRHELAYSTDPTDGPSYNIYKIYAGMAKRLTNINEIQLGASVSYYESFHTFIHLTEYYNHLQYLASTVWTLHVGHEFLIKRFGLVTDLGIKVIDPFYRSYFLDREWSLWHKAIFAPRAGFKFYPIWNSFASQKLALGMFIKTNCGQADFVEFSLSYTF